MKRTFIFERRPHATAHLGQDGSTVYVLHPDDPENILTMPHATEAAASATFAKVKREYFGANIGWSVEFERDTIDVSSWIPKVTPEQQTHADVARAGFRKQGSAMAMTVHRDPDDFDAILAHAHDATSLHCLLGLEDNVDKLRRPALLTKLARGAAPNVTELIFESPWFQRPNLRKLPLKPPAALLERPTLRRFAAVGEGVWPTTTELSLTHLRLETTFTRAMLAQICNIPGLRVLQIAISKGAEDAARQLLPGHALDELTIEYLDDVAAMIDALLDGERLPSLVRLQGRMKTGPALRAAIARWQAEAKGSALQLGVWPMDILDEPTREVVANAGIPRYTSPFCAEYELIVPFKPWNHRP